MPPKKRQPAGPASRRVSPEVVGLRIVGGRFRGRKLLYSGDFRTRPMKDRLREAVFNLIGPDVAGKHAVDLFGGTGALGLEALSRGAARATFIEQHHPTADLIGRNAAELGLRDCCSVVPGNVFLWFRRRPDLGTDPWLVFCSPPYDFYVERCEEMLTLIGGLIRAAPPGSAFMVEADERFDFGLLPAPEEWDVRSYPPAVVGMHWVTP
jgi:16S rRNA (guanine966-N2)-methyltransferase